MSINILGIESSCDDTSAAVLSDGRLCSSVINTQTIHGRYGGVVPELASRAHQQNIVPVVREALFEAGMSLHDLSAIAFTKGPGLLGSLLVGTSFAKGLSVATGLPLIGVNHLHGHIYAHFVGEKNEANIEPTFPFLCLLISGGHTQIVVVKSHLNFEIIGQTIDDAAGEAFDKCAKVMGLGYPGGPVVDKYAQQGNPLRFTFGKPQINGLNFSFSGLKTSFLYFLRDQLRENKNFIGDNLCDLCASLQKTIIDILMDKLMKAVKQTGISEIAVSGGVSANGGLRRALSEIATKHQLNIRLPKIKYTTDNAAMIAIIGHYMFKKGLFDDLSVAPNARLKFTI